MIEIILQILLSIILPAIISAIVAIIVFQNKVLFEKLHTERTYIIKELWGMINLNYNTLFKLHEEKQRTSRFNEEHLSGLLEKLKEMRLFFDSNSIYFNEDMKKKFQTLYFRDFQGSFSEDNYLQLVKTLREMKKPLEEEFRKILGVK